MLRAATSALLSHWRRQKLQLAMLLLGLSLATALWSGVQAINAEARASYARAAGMLGGDRLEQLLASDGGRIGQSSYIDLRRAGWQVSPVLEGELRYSGMRLRIIGIEPLTLPPQAQLIDLATGDGEGRPGDLLSFIGAPGALYVSVETARQLQAAGTAETALPPLHTAAGIPPGTAIVDIGQAQRLLSAPSQITRLIVAPDQPAGLEPVAGIAPGLILKKPDSEGDLSRLTDSFHLNLTAFGMLAFVVGLFIVHAAIGLAFEQRRQTFRTLRSLGLAAGTLTWLLLAELLALALLAGAAGVLCGYLVASFLLPDVSATLQGLYGASVPGTLTLRPSWWLAGLAIAVSGTVASAAGGLWRVWRMPLLDAGRPRAWARASQATAKIQAATGALLLIAAALLLWRGGGLVAGFTILGGLLCGAALLLPPLLALVLHVAQRLSRRPLTEWFWADTRQQLPGLSLALMALLLALATNIGVGSMVASFRLTFTGWLDQRLASELYVTARNPDEATAMLDWLRPRTDAILPIWNIEADVAGQPARIYGVADHDTYRRHWPILSAMPDVWERVADGSGVLVNEQLARRERLAPGDTLQLPGDWQATIAGIYSDYGNPSGQVIVSVDMLTRHFPGVQRLYYGLRVAPAKAPQLAQDLRARFSLPAQNVVDQARIKDVSLGIFEKTFTVTAALNVLTLAVAGLAVFSSMVTLSGMRLPQLAPVWAMGLTRRHMVRLELLRTLFLCAVTLFAALPVGVALAWVLLAVVNVEAFGWRLPLHLFPADWLRLAGLAFLAALVAALVPLLRIARLSPAALLQVFSNER